MLLGFSFIAALTGFTAEPETFAEAETFYDSFLTRMVQAANRPGGPILFPDRRRAG